MLDYVLGQIPLRTFALVIFPPQIRDPVVGAPLPALLIQKKGCNVSVFLHAGEGGVQGGLFDNIFFLRHKLDLPGNLIAVRRLL
jgi:hypothetical protein